MLLLPIAAALLQSPGTPLLREDFAVVVHAKNPITDLSAEDLRRLFRAEKQFWSQSTPVDLLLPRSGS